MKLFKRGFRLKKIKPILPMNCVYCGKEFTPLTLQDQFCYDINCIEARKALDQGLKDFQERLRIHTQGKLWGKFRDKCLKAVEVLKNRASGPLSEDDKELLLSQVEALEFLGASEEILNIPIEELRLIEITAQETVTEIDNYIELISKNREYLSSILSALAEYKKSLCEGVSLIYHQKELLDFAFAKLKGLHCMTDSTMTRERTHVEATEECRDL